MAKGREPGERILRGVHATRVKAWDLPDMSRGDAGSITDVVAAETEEAEQPAGWPTAAELEALQQQAREEGYEQGRQEGQEYGHREALEEGRKQLAERLTRLDGLMAALESPFQALDEAVVSELAVVITRAAERVVRRELKTEPTLIVELVREALKVLPSAARKVRVHLHPDDAVLVREAYARTESEQEWTLAEDPALEPGGCRVTTEHSQVDATLAQRLDQVLAPLLEGQTTPPEADA